MKKKTTQSQPTPSLESEKPKVAFKEFYDSCVRVLLHGTKEQQKKIIEILNKNEGELPWVRAKLITDAYEAADAKGREEFCLLTMKNHLRSGNAALLDQTFTDQETGVVYRLYKFKNGKLHRIPFVTEKMDKYAFDKAMNKHFLDDFIEMTSHVDVMYIPLNTQGKVDLYNQGKYFETYRLGQHKQTKEGYYLPKEEINER